LLITRVERSASRGARYDHMGVMLVITFSIQVGYCIPQCL